MFFLQIFKLASPQLVLRMNIFNKLALGQRICPMQTKAKLAWNLKLIPLQFT